MNSPSFSDPSTSSSPSTSSLELTLHKQPWKCQICNKPAHGYHHGALTCRACCIFFRRSTDKYKTWKCLAQNKCEISYDKHTCKKCRMNKCIQIGMHMENFQHTGENLKKDEFTRFKRISDLPVSLEKFIGRPHIIIRCEPKSSKVRKMFLDLSGLIEMGSMILSKPYQRNEASSSIQKLAVHSRKLRNKKSYGNTVYQKIGKKESLMFCELDFCRTAEWLIHFDEFQNLPISLRMKFLKSIWHVRSVLEKVVLTAEKRVKNEISEFMVPMDDGAAVDTEKLIVDLSWCTHYETDKMGYFLDAYYECLHLDAATKLLMDLKPTDVEQNFLFLQICFSYAGRLHGGEILEVSEKLIETVSNQMHDYYSNVLKMPNYSGRIARLLKCEQFIQGFITTRKRKIEIGQIFDIFDIEYSHPEMFINSGFS